MQVQEVEIRLPAQGGWRGYVESPSAGSIIDSRDLDIEGWVIGEGDQPVAVEVALDGTTVARAAVARERPDVAAVFPDAPGAMRSGFRLGVGLSGRSRGVEMILHVITSSGRRVPFAAVRGFRRWRQSRGPERDLVSVVITSYDHAHYLADAIESALGQSYPHVEIVVIDDGSHDNAAAVAARYEPVRYVRQVNQGPGAARNTGIRVTNGDYIVFLDADDRLSPTAVESGVRRLTDASEAAFAAGLYEYIDGDGRPMQTPEQKQVNEDAYAALLRTNVVGQPGCVLFRRSVFEHFRGWNSDRRISGAADYELYLRVAREFPIVFHRDVVCLYRRHGGNMSGNSSMMREQVLRVHAAQKPYVSGEHLRRAYAEGRAFWQGYYGRRTVGERLHAITRLIDRRAPYRQTI